jgi:C4-dicarboxylate transporter DctM subunit
MVYAGIRAHTNPAYAGESSPFTFKRLWDGIRTGILTMLIPVIILGGILGGIFTATESGAFAVITAIILGLIIFRSMKLKDVWTAVKGTAETLGNFAIIFAAANAFSWMLARQGGAKLLADTLLNLTDNGIIIMLLMNAILLIAGCFIDTLSNVILFTPIFLPIAMAYGYTPVHFGTIMVINLTFGTITPPLGTSMFMACGIAKIKMEEFVKEILPIYIPMILLLLVVIFVPAISQWLPGFIMK